jgi:hypothetical protein
MEIIDGYIYIWLRWYTQSIGGTRMGGLRHVERLRLHREMGGRHAPVLEAWD